MYVIDPIFHVQNLEYGQNIILPLYDSSCSSSGLFIKQTVLKECRWLFLRQCYEYIFLLTTVFFFCDLGCCSVTAHELVMH
jgi:hypothetical protein